MSDPSLLFSGLLLEVGGAGIFVFILIGGEIQKQLKRIADALEKERKP
jgi:hypothetical protein